jgi:hypothetical protein
LDKTSEKFSDFQLEIRACHPAKKNVTDKQNFFLVQMQQKKKVPKNKQD